MEEENKRNIISDIITMERFPIAYPLFVLIVLLIFAIFLWQLVGKWLGIWLGV